MSEATPSLRTERTWAAGEDAPVFAAATRRRAHLVNCFVAVLALAVAVWLAALVAGGAGFATLPAWRGPGGRYVSARLGSPHRVPEAGANHMLRVRRDSRHGLRHGLRS